MSFLSKLFLILSILTSILFVVVAAALLAKQQNFEARYGKELIERQRDERLQELQRHYLAAVKDRNQRTVQQARVRTLIAVSANHVAISEQQQIDDLLQTVRAAVNQFNTGFEFPRIQTEYASTLDGLVQRTQQLAERADDMVGRKTDLMFHLARAESELARMREHLNVLDMQLFELRRSNMEFREVANLYLEADPTLAVPGLGGALLPVGTVVAVDASNGAVVIDVGLNEDAQPNMIFTVTDPRSGEYVAQIELTEVHDTRSVGRIIASTQRRPVSVGNTVRPRAVTAGY